MTCCNPPYSNPFEVSATWNPGWTTEAEQLLTENSSDTAATTAAARRELWIMATHTMAGVDNSVLARYRWEFCL